MYKQAISLCASASEKQWLALRFEAGLSVDVAAKRMNISDNEAKTLEADVLRFLRGAK